MKRNQIRILNNLKSKSNHIFYGVLDKPGTNKGKESTISRKVCLL